MKASEDQSLEQPKKTDITDQASKIYQQVAKTTERVGIPVGTFSAGVVSIILSTVVHLDILTWLGTFLIVAALGTYIWLTSRSTIKVQQPTPSIPTELKELVDWMKNEITIHNDWARAQMEKTNNPKEKPEQ